MAVQITKKPKKIEEFDDGFYIKYEEGATDTEAHDGTIYVIRDSDGNIIYAYFFNDDSEDIEIITDEEKYNEYMEKAKQDPVRYFDDFPELKRGILQVDLDEKGNIVGIDFTSYRDASRNLRSLEHGGR